MTLFKLSLGRTVWSSAEGLQKNLGELCAGDIILRIKTKHLIEDADISLCLTKHGVGWVYSIGYVSKRL